MNKKIKNEIKVIGNLFPSNHSAGRIYSPFGIAPAVRFNGLTVITIAYYEELNERNNKTV